MSTETATTLLKLLVHATRSYEHTLEQALRPALDERLRPAHFAVFRYLDPEGSRITALADAAGMTQQSMGELVTHLAACGYVERRVDPADRRARLVVATPAGRSALRRARREIEAIERALAARLGESTVAGLRAALAGVADVLGEGAR
ncbi:winged helix DNA-binding protein [Nocardia farcinica]|uniref:Homoprotocatechuate degradation operon regulator, HpaR n=1 Tax=Nocardia farcinica TaxID=37329 RepID=A0A0H5NP88_NOCFR|nr:MarR family transcriptional regulator [Nocardia farcinica]AXK85576.1 MarR family transcriptional regulator [Nocardia farcinica]MBA4859428.1 winged helix DNA-binding protein [Nocardia farcinica]MBC9819555.1 winged helix DNA-binding protein [Nocardia farcinica]MBF6072608.1 winged helix DNA-binding protein [Nocardia farcinica]MBF6259829.1 winged helix DNA-binding protein [Nocardia farcinica]